MDTTKLTKIVSHVIINVLYVLLMMYVQNVLIPTEFLMFVIVLMDTMILELQLVHNVTHNVMNVQEQQTIVINVMFQE